MDIKQTIFGVALICASQLLNATSQHAEMFHPNAVLRDPTASQIDYSDCKRFCVTTITTSSDIQFWVQDVKGKVIFSKSLRPDWLNSMELPAPEGQRLVRMVALEAHDPQKAGPSGCYDGWGYATGGIVSANQVGTMTMVVTYAAGGQGVMSIEYENGTGDSLEVDVQPSDGAESSPICSAMRATHNEPK